MNRQELFQQIQYKKSYLCIGLDTDITKIPVHLLKEKDPVFEFNKQIIDATNAYCVAYKPNIAFYEALGPKGWESLQKTLEYIPREMFTIADAKRGDIGNTSQLYARAFFDKHAAGLDFDAITISPYMGEDSVKPFMEFDNKWVIVLAITSNTGSRDFQFLQTEGEELFLKVIKTVRQWAMPDQLMFVVGATRASEIKKAREAAPDNFFLVPGIGAQGGDLKEVSQNGMNSQCGLLVNSSRNIIYASEGKDYYKYAAKAAQDIQKEMELCLSKFL
jgi:orotidine-5'-phosphate decarboxylase